MPNTTMECGDSSPLSAGDLSPSHRFGMRRIGQPLHSTGFADKSAKGEKR